MIPIAGRTAAANTIHVSNCLWPIAVNYIRLMVALLSRLLESTPHEKVLHRIHTNAAAVSVIKANALADEKTEAHVEDEVADELNISLDSLLKVLARYDFPPSACSHIRGQEQIFGSRIGRDDKKNKVTAFGRYIFLLEIVWILAMTRC